MKRSARLARLHVATGALAIMLVVWQGSAAQSEAPAPAEGPGWTGLTDPAAVIAARQALMLAIEERMLPIDLYTVDDSIEPEVVTANAATIAAMLEATPHLYPPTTNLYDPDANYPQTLALPQIWADFATFAAMADASVAAAHELADGGEPATLGARSTKLRATCDGCHALHLRPYVPSQVSEEDLNFDFDSLFDE